MILRRIAVLGGGPAGLYFAYRWKRRQPESEVEVFEQNPAGATFGFGVVFSDRALDFLRQDDPETADLIAPRMEAWQDITLVHRGKCIAIDARLLGHRTARVPGAAAGARPLGRRRAPLRCAGAIRRRAARVRPRRRRRRRELAP